MRKGISPLIATVLLVGFAVSVAAILYVWIPGFTRQHTEQVGEHAGREIYCAYGGIGVSNLQYCNGRLSGTIRNTNMVDLGNITVQITYKNATPAQTVYLTQSGIAGTHSNMTLRPNEIASFNVTIGGSNYNNIHVFTNCSNVYDDSVPGDVTATC